MSNSGPTPTPRYGGINTYLRNSPHSTMSRIKLVEGRWSTCSRSYNISFANDRDAKPPEANAIEIDHINQFSRLAHNHSFEKAATDSDSCSRRKPSFESARKLCRVSLENSYRSLHYSRRCRFTAGVNTRHTSRGRHYFMIDPL